MTVFFLIAETQEKITEESFKIMMPTSLLYRCNKKSYVKWYLILYDISQTRWMTNYWGKDQEKSNYHFSNWSVEHDWTLYKARFWFFEFVHCSSYSILQIKSRFMWYKHSTGQWVGKINWNWHQNRMCDRMHNHCNSVLFSPPILD